MKVKSLKRRLFAKAFVELGDEMTFRELEDSDGLKLLKFFQGLDNHGRSQFEEAGKHKNVPVKGIIIGLGQENIQDGMVKVLHNGPFAPP